MRSSIDGIHSITIFDEVKYVERKAAREHYVQYILSIAMPNIFEVFFYFDLHFSFRLYVNV